MDPINYCNQYANYGIRCARREFNISQSQQIDEINEISLRIGMNEYFSANVTALEERLVKIINEPSVSDLDKKNLEQYSKRLTTLGKNFSIIFHRYQLSKQQIISDNNNNNNDEVSSDEENELCENFAELRTEEDALEGEQETNSEDDDFFYDFEQFLNMYFKTNK